ncbi:NfeD family protein [Acanthopleuribacter pedis]|uniref:NfeD-like C-terminal domain-containing protein n=1 Tax=Acanthopleuribacter pedis TaxID=442870 RepID=A0A8J7U3K0_9BACT|nr:NfeD family protein [Acanthopleuribacter pedis]MBO1318839.1 hypothetical protein [Acanthopleuribacter pedis]
MVWIVLLTLAGFGFIVLDVIALPGSIFVALGIGMIGYSVYLNFMAHGPVSAGVHFVVCASVIPVIVLRLLKRYALKGEMNAEEGFVGVDSHSDLIGSSGVAFSDLRPAGKVRMELDGKSVDLDCIAESSFIEAGTEVVVVEERGPSLVVAKRR